METREDFKKHVKKEAYKAKPSNWRNGQTIFNYVEDVYGVARKVQFEDGIDCFYTDNTIEEFLDAVYNTLCEYENFRGNK